MIKHKITALFIVFVMIISCFGFISVSAEDASVLSDKYNLVTDLEITDITTGNITRGDFCVMLANTITYKSNWDNMAAHTKYPFEDVTPSVNSYDAIKYLKSIGLINGYNQNMFLPDKEIVLEEAVSIIMRHLKLEGITDDSKLYGLAVKYKLLKDIDISTRDILDAQNAIKLIYNLIQTNILNSEEYYYEDAKYFYQIMGLEEFEGMVNDDGTCSINGESTLGEDKILVDNEVYYNFTGKKDLFAYEVSGYYIIDNKSGRKAIVSISTLEDSNLIFKADQIKSYGDYLYEFYDDNNRSSSYKLSKKFTLIYNGRLVVFDNILTEEKFIEMMMPKSGSVMLVDTNGGREYDIVKIKSYHNMVAGVVSRNNDGSINIINKYDAKDSFVINSFMDVSVLTSTGNVRTVDSLSKDTALAIAKSYDGKTVEIILGSNAKKGKIKEKSAYKYKIDSNEYEISTEFSKLLENHPEKSPSCDKAGTYYLTFENKILYYDSTGRDDYVYALFGEVGSQGFDYKISFYTEDNNYVILSLKDKIKIDSKTYNEDDAQDYFNSKAAKLKCTMVQIKYDDEMNITEIDIPYVEADGFVSNGSESAASLHYIKNLKEKNHQYKAWLTAFDNQVCVTDATKMFFLPEGENDIKEAKVITQTSRKFNEDTGVITISAFSTKEDALVADAMFIRDYYYPNVRESSENDNLEVVVIKEIRQTVTSDDIEATVLYVTDGYYENTYIYESQEPWGYYYENGETKKKILDTGDIIKIGVDDQKRIANENVMLIYDCSGKIQHYQGSVYATPNIWSWNSYSTPGGYIYRKAEGYIEFTQKDPADVLDYTNDTTYIFPTTKANVIMTEKINDEYIVSYKNMTDVITYKESQNDYDKKIIINNRAGELLTVFVYR